VADNENIKFIWAAFPNEDTAVEAATSLKTWDKADDGVKLGAIGVLSRTDQGQLKVMAYRASDQRALIGAVADMLVATFAPATLMGGLVAGAVVGSLLGALYKKGLGLSDEQKNKIKTNLDAGKGLLIVLLADDEVAATTARLRELGGETENTQAAMPTPLMRSLLPWPKPDSGKYCHFSDTIAMDMMPKQ
jgi:uncharacterized membrane protein